MTCPYCQSQNVSEDLHDWFIMSEEDPENRGTTQEHQCRDCGAAFWCDAERRS